MYRRTATITVSALAAAAEETYTITETGYSTRAQARPTIGKQIGDVVVVNGAPDQEATWAITSAWVDSLGVIKFTATNVHASAALTGGSLVVTYCVLR
jgi:uncharacterized phosphosugar-binding protein